MAAGRLGHIINAAVGTIELLRHKFIGLQSEPAPPHPLRDSHKDPLRLLTDASLEWPIRVLLHEPRAKVLQVRAVDTSLAELINSAKWRNVPTIMLFKQPPVILVPPNWVLFQNHIITKFLLLNVNTCSKKNLFEALQFRFVVSFSSQARPVSCTNMLHNTGLNNAGVRSEGETEGGLIGSRIRSMYLRETVHSISAEIEYPQADTGFTLPQFCCNRQCRIISMRATSVQVTVRFLHVMYFN